MAIKFILTFCGLNVPENDINVNFFTAVSIDSIVVYENKYYLQVFRQLCLENFRQTYLVDNPFFKTDEG